jgi:hypothetical protein
MVQRVELTRESAETVAIHVLSFLSEEPDRLGRFLAVTGIEIDSLRDAAREPNFLLGVLDYLAADEPLLRQFSGQADIPPEVISRARDLLAGMPPTTA